MGLDFSYVQLPTFRPPDWLLSAAIVLLVLLALGGYFHRKISRKLSELIREFMRDSGEECIGVHVEMEFLDVHPLSGTLEIRGLEVANPPGYSTKNALTVETFQVHFDIFHYICSLGKAVCIEYFRLIDLVAVMESHGNPFGTGANALTSNLHELMDRMETQQQRHHVRKIMDVAEAMSPERVHLQVQNVDIEGIQGSFFSSAFPSLDMSLKIPDLKIGNFTKDVEATDSLEVAFMLIDLVLGAVVKALVINVIGLANPENWCSCLHPDVAAGPE